jgi:hypothetical protein
VRAVSERCFAICIDCVEIWGFGSGETADDEVDVVGLEYVMQRREF